MHEAPALMLAWVGGGSLGAMVFGGLWWTVRRGLSARRPALWFFGSLLLRMSVAMAGVYFIGAGRWERLLACLVGFAMARPVVSRLTRPAAEARAREAVHAPQS